MTTNQGHTSRAIGFVSKSITVQIIEKARSRSAVASTDQGIIFLPIQLGDDINSHRQPNQHDRTVLTSRHQPSYALMMRTTLTLDDDVAAILERLRRKRRASLKELINEALRRGLNDMGRRRGPREPIATRAVALGRMRIASIDNIGEALTIVEGENFK